MVTAENQQSIGRADRVGLAGQRTLLMRFCWGKDEIERDIDDWKGGFLL